MRTALACVVLLSACGARTAPLVDDGSAPRCEPSIEACNGADDDCDGSVDEGLPLTALGDPIVLRSPGETRTGDCRTCDQVLRAEVLPVDDDVLVLWQMNFQASEPQPNTFARRLDAGGDATAPASLWTGRLTTMALEAVLLPDGQRALAFCERLAGRDDRASLVRVRADGAEAPEPARIGTTEPCTADGMSAGWTSERLLLLRRNILGLTELDIVGTDLRTLETVELGPSDQVSLASAPDRALVFRAYHPIGAALHWSAQLLDSRGSANGAPGPAVLARDSMRFVVLPTQDGWRALQAGEGGLATQGLSIDGTPTGAPRGLGGDGLARWVRGLGLSDGGAVVVAERVDGARTGRRERSELHVMAPGDDVTSTWSSDELGEPPWRAPALRLIRGRVAIVYTTGAPDELHNDVRVRWLACQP